MGVHNHERQTAWWLGRLPDGWHLFNDIPVGERGATIDHVIVGPAGVFTVNAKHLKGNVWIGASGVRVNGRATDFVRTSLREAKRAARLLSAELDRPVDVRPVLAILADGWTIKEPPTGVFIGPPRGVKDWLRGLPAVLSSHDVTLVAAAAAKPMTWQETP